MIPPCWFFFRAGRSSRQMGSRHSLRLRRLKRSAEHTVGAVGVDRLLLMLVLLVLLIASLVLFRRWPRRLRPVSPASAGRAQGWLLCRECDVGGQAHLRIFTRVTHAPSRPPVDGRAPHDAAEYEIWLQAESSHGVAEVLALFAEVDLLPTWNPLVRCYLSPALPPWATLQSRPAPAHLPFPSLRPLQ
jgi:hypothetical protein